MAHVLLWSCIICFSDIVLTTFVRCGRIPATLRDTAMGEIRASTPVKVRERFYRDGPVKPIVVRRSASSNGTSEADDAVLKVLPANELNRVASELTAVTDSATTVAAVDSATTYASSASASATASADASATGKAEKADKELSAEGPTPITSESMPVTDSSAVTVAAVAATDAAAAVQSSVSLSANAPNAPLYFHGCSMNPCRNAGVCKLQPFGANKIFCRCLPGFFGEFCQYDAPECQMDPCLHNGECRRSMTEPRGYECQCTDEYEGDNCETMVTTYAEAVLPVGVTDASDLSSAVSSPPVPQTTTTSFFLQMPFLAMVAVSLLMLALSLFATIDAERKIVIERYAVLTAHGYVVEYPKAGYLRLAMRKFLFLTCLCCSVFPCLDGYFAQQAEEQIPLSVLLKTSQHKGYAPLPQTSDRGPSPASAAFSPTPSGAGR